MCGIAGFVLKHPQGRPSEILKDMADRIVYRGPDDEGYFSTVAKRNGATVGLAHRRLSIIDLAGGHQPMHNDRGTTHIVFNGEIYNYKDLRAELESFGYRFSSSSDTETIIAAYDEWGSGCVDKLHGMFAFAIWNDEKGELLLARDRFGKKPLYLWQNDGDVIFASEIKCILANDLVKRKINRYAVWDYLQYRYIPWPQTLFEGIEKLPPASYALWNKDGLTVTRYYSPPDRYRLKKDAVSQSDVVSGFMAELERAVEIRISTSSGMTGNN